MLSVFVPHQALLCRRCDEPRVLAEYDDPDGRGKVIITETYEYHPDTQIKHITTRHRIEETEEIGSLTMRMYYPQELTALIKYNGFEVIARWGDFDQHAFGADSKLQVLVCQAAETAYPT